MKLKKFNYNSAIKAYYEGNLNKSLIELIVKSFWLAENDIERDSRFELIKDNVGRGSSVYKLSFGEQNYYLKVYSPQRLKKKIKNIFRPVEGIRYFQVTNKLLAAGIPVVKPTLGLVFKRNIFEVDSIFITKELVSDNVEQYIKKENCSKELRKEIIEKMTYILSQLINNNFLHQDPIITNFLINFDDKKPKLTLVDIDNIYPLPFLPKQVALNNLAKFKAKMIVSLSRKDCKLLSRREIILIFKTFISNYSKTIDIEKFIKNINKKVIKRLKKRDKEDVNISFQKLNELLKIKKEEL